jgi:hypothetical protein
MKTSEFMEPKIRNGISLPSILRRKYRVDEMPVRGSLKTKLFFGFKVAALNYKKLLDYLSRRLETGILLVVRRGYCSLSVYRIILKNLVLC